jgi:hypothetical protein
VDAVDAERIENELLDCNVEWLADDELDQQAECAVVAVGVSPNAPVALGPGSEE